MSPSTPESASAFPAPSSADAAHWFKEQVQPHDGQLKSYLRGSFPSIRDVDDVVQESYLRVWKVYLARPIQFAKPFLFTVARHLALRIARRESRSPVTYVGDLAELRVIEESRNPSEALSYRDKVGLLADALTLLPARCREVVILRKLHCLPQKEVAAQLGLSERTVENQLAKGVRRCREFFRERGVEGLF